MPRKFDWTPELIDRVRRLYWDEQRSPIEIVAILGLSMTARAITVMLKREGIGVRPWQEALCLRPQRTLTEEWKQKISLSEKGQPSTRVNWHPSEEHKAKLRLCRRSAEVRAKISKASRAMWQDPKHKEEHLRASRQALAKRPTMPEQKVAEAIASYGLPYVYNGSNCLLIIQGRCPDFANIDGKKAVIEVFGDYWHRVTKDYWQTEQGRHELFEAMGFNLLVLWEKHIKEVPIEVLAEEIKAFTDSC